jgi:hypothetical protein
MIRSSLIGALIASLNDGDRLTSVVELTTPRRVASLRGWSKESAAVRAISCRRPNPMLLLLLLLLSAVAADESQTSTITGSRAAVRPRRR